MSAFQKKQEFFEQGSELEDYEDSENLENDFELDLELDELDLSPQELEAEEEIGQRLRVPLRPPRTRPLSPRPVRPRPQPAGRRPPAYRPKPPRAIRRHPRSVSVDEPVTCICPEKTCPEHGTEYIRWVQSALNGVLGLRLRVDGTMDAATRSALRRFQEQHNLPVDGIAGPETKEALVRARGGRSASPQQSVDRTVDTQADNKPGEPLAMEPVPLDTAKQPEPMTPASEFDFKWENFDHEGELDFPEFESSAEIAQKKLLNFREKVHLRPQDYRKLLLAARLHPFPRASLVITRYPVTPTDDLYALILEAFGLSNVEYDQIIDELKRIADRKFGPEIAAEEKLVVEAAKVIAFYLKEKKLKPILLEAAMLDPKELEKVPGALTGEFYKLGLRLVGEIGDRTIIESEMSEAQLVKLGWRFAEYANNLRKKGGAFKNEVDQERRRRQLQQQQERKRRSRKRN